MRRIFPEDDGTHVCKCSVAEHRDEPAEERVEDEEEALPPAVLIDEVEVLEALVQRASRRLLTVIMMIHGQMLS